MRQIFCKLPNPFPYLNYITKFFFGRKSYRQRVFQGPLTLGLQSPSLRASSFRLACGNPSIPARSQLTALNRAPAVLHPSVRVGYNRPFHSAGALAGFSCSGTRAQFYYRANRVPVVLHLSVRVGYNRPLHSVGALAGFPARVPSRSHLTAQTAHLLFCILLSVSVTTDVSIPRVLSQVFPARVPARSQLTALNRAPVTFASFCLRRLQPTFALRGCARRFSCSDTRAQLYYRANRAPAVLHLSVRVGYNRPLHSAGALAGFPARVLPRSHIAALNRAPVVFASFCSRRLQPVFATRLHLR